ncbi:hypothetical protein ABZ470_39850 [Streptosporangium sp. NPDC020072]|uniref:hypothetical protein n=1 Tax=Streptosporangium sp. NPDC020072 TaxID=3154788 RepID=UPI0034469616
MTHSTFLGLPIVGDILPGPRGSIPGAQQPLEDLKPLMRGLLNNPAVAAFGWYQYTDPDLDAPNEFKVQGPIWIRTIDADDYDHSELELGERHPTLGDVRWDRDLGEYVRVPRPPEKDDVVRYGELLADELESGKFLAALAELFGEDAEVTVSHDAIDIERFNHG